MSEIKFPASLRPIVSKGYGQTRGGNISRTNVQGGMPRQSRDNYYDSVPINVTLVTGALGRQAFWSFITKVNGGASSFQMNHDTGLGIQPHNVLITSGISDTTQDGLNWIIQFTATAERTAIQDSNCLTENLPDLYGCYGDGLNCFLDAYEQYCTSYPFVLEPNVIASFDASNQDFVGIGFSRDSSATYNQDGVLLTAIVDEPRFEGEGIFVELSSKNYIYNSGTITFPMIEGGTPVTYDTSTLGNFRFVKQVASSSAGSSPDAATNIGALSIGDTITFSAVFKMYPGDAGRFRMRISDGGAFYADNSFYCDMRVESISNCIHIKTQPFADRSLVMVEVIRTITTPTVGVVGARLQALQAPGIAHVGCFQLEKKPSASSYIPTSVTTATRAPDMITLQVDRAKRVYREYTPLNSETQVIETVPYTGELCPPGHLRVIKVLND